MRALGVIGYVVIALWAWAIVSGVLRGTLPFVYREEESHNLLGHILTLLGVYVMYPWIGWKLISWSRRKRG